MSYMWIIYALLSAIMAALVAILRDLENLLLPAGRQVLHSLNKKQLSLDKKP